MWMNLRVHRQTKIRGITGYIFLKASRPAREVECERVGRDRGRKIRGERRMDEIVLGGM